MVSTSVAQSKCFLRLGSSDFSVGDLRFSNGNEFGPGLTFVVWDDFSFTTERCVVSSLVGAVVPVWIRCERESNCQREHCK